MGPIAAKPAEILGQDGDREQRQAANAARLAGEIAAFLGRLASSQATPAVAAAPVLAGMGARFATLPGPLAPVVELRRSDTSDLTDAQRAVLETLADGQFRSGAITERTGLAPATVSRSLAVLADRGLATRQTHGEWTPASGAA